MYSGLRACQNAQQKRREKERTREVKRKAMKVRAAYCADAASKARRQMKERGMGIERDGCAHSAHAVLTQQRARESLERNAPPNKNADEHVNGWNLKKRIARVDEPGHD